MNVVFISEMNYFGKVDDTFPNMSVLFSQINSMKATHIPLYKVFENIKIIEMFDICVFIYPKSNPEVLQIIPELKKYVKIVLNQEGSRDFWYDWTPEQQQLLLNAFEQCDMFFANNKEDLLFFQGFMIDKVKLSPVCFNSKAIEFNKSNKQENSVLIGGNMCKWYGGLSSLEVAKIANLPITIPSMGRKQYNEEMLSSNIDIIYLPFLQYDEWITEVSKHKYIVHLMSEIGGGNLSLLASALGIPCIGNKLWDTQKICQPELAINIWELNKGKELLKKLKEDNIFYKKCSQVAKQNAYKYFLKEVTGKIHLKYFGELE